MIGADNSRIETFRQFKKEIRGSSEYMIVGIDIAKDKHHAFFGTANGKSILRRLVFDNNLQGFEKLGDRVMLEMTQNGLSKVVFGLEPTANYDKPLAEHLIKCAKLIVLTSGEAIANNRKSLDGRWDSNDTKDSANVADLVSQAKCQFYEYPLMPIRELRNLLSWKRRLKKQEHGLKVRIRNHLLAQYFPELDRYFGAGGQEILNIIKWCLSPNQIVGMEFDKFLQIVAPRERGLRQRKRLKDIWDLALDSIGCDAGEALDFEASMMVENLLQARNDIKAVSEKITHICGTFPEYHYLLTIPGFGPDISSKVLAAIGNPSRFDNTRQLLKMAGFDLNAKRSGKTSDSAVPRISKKGKAWLRFALYQAAVVATSFNKHFIVYFTKQLKGREKERGIKTKKRVKLASKMLVIAWTLMKKEEPFNPMYLYMT
jgi:transposase